MRNNILIGAACALLCVVGAARAQRCPPGFSTLDAQKSRRLYLYFPDTTDTAFPRYQTWDGRLYNQNWSVNDRIAPVGPFQPTALGLSDGDRRPLIDAIRDVVVNHFCEFNVEVRTEDGTSPDDPSSPLPATPRWSIVAIDSNSRCGDRGTCSSASATSPRWGAAQVDLADATTISYGRVWAGTHHYTVPDLLGTAAPLNQWALAVGGSASHEGAHTLGVRHDCCPASDDCGGCNRASEDSVDNHLMLSQPASHADHTRVRHFSDVSFSILAANIGLSVKTAHNWDFVNPNPVAARRLEMIVMVLKGQTLRPVWVYADSLSPWSSMDVSSSPLTWSSIPELVRDHPDFPESRYDAYKLVWQAPKDWVGGTAADGTDGTVPGRPASGMPRMFHVGATFAGVGLDQPTPLFVRDVALYPDRAGTLPRLPLSPRMFGYDTGGIVGAGGGAGGGAGAARAEGPAPGMRPGDFRIRFFNDRPGRPLILRNLVVHELPRVASIETMVRGAKLASWDGVAVIPWRSTQLGDFTVKDVLDVKIATLSQKRHVFEDHRRREGEIEKGKKEKGAKGESAPELNKSIEVRQGGPPGGPHGPATIDIDLFPSTTVYLTARAFDPSTNLESGLFYQFAGFHPDLDNNGVDDVIDIATGEARDADGDGIPDPPRPWWIILLLSLLGALALLILIIVLVRRRAAAPR